MSGQRAIGRVVLRVVIASLVVAGVVASVALVSDDFSDVDWMIIATSTLLAITSATVGAGFAVRPRYALLGGATAVLSVLAFALVNLGMWGEIDGAGFWRATGCVAIAALDGAHASFVLSLYAQVGGVVLTFQLVCTAVVPLLRRLGADAERPVGAPPAPAERLAATARTS